MLVIFLSSNNVFANAPIETFALQGTLVRILVDPIKDEVYVVYFSNFIEVFDGSLKYKKSHIYVNNPKSGSPVQIYHATLAPDRKRLYLVSQKDGLFVIDTETKEVINNITLPYKPSRVEASPNSDKVWILSEETNTVTVIKEASKLSLEDSPGPTSIMVGKFPYGSAINQVTNKVYVANRDSNTITVIDEKTNSVINTINAGKRPTEIVSDLNSNKLYVFNTGDYAFSIIDAQTDTIIDSISAKVIQQPLFGNKNFIVRSRLALDPFNSKIYLTDLYNWTLTILDLKTKKINNVVVLEKPFFVSLNPLTNTIYISLANNNIGVGQLNKISSISKTYLDQIKSTLAELTIVQRNMLTSVNPSKKAVLLIERLNSTILNISSTLNMNPYICALLIQSHASNLRRAVADIKDNNCNGLLGYFSKGKSDCLPAIIQTNYSPTLQRLTIIVASAIRIDLNSDNVPDVCQR